MKSRHCFPSGASSVDLVPLLPGRERSWRAARAVLVAGLSIGVSLLAGCVGPGDGAPGGEDGSPGEESGAAGALSIGPGGATGCAEALSGPGAAAAWCRKGGYFTWESTTTPGVSLQIFWGCAGSPSAPAIYMNHGFPTSSFDFDALVSALSATHRVCWLDTPGYGFSDKPAVYTYSIFEDAAIVDHFVREIAGLQSFALLTHDKGDSVGLELLRLYEEKLAAGESPGYTLTHHFLLNGNVYLPLADLTQLQLALLDPETGPEYADSMSGGQLALGLGLSTYSPPLSAQGMIELARVFDYQDGTSVMDSTVQYLNERSEHELEWLAAIGESEVPLTIVWGEEDDIAPTDVADYVWDNYAAPRPAAARYYRHPCANHYLPTDHAADVATIVEAALAGTTATFPASACAPYVLAEHP